MKSRKIVRTLLLILLAVILVLPPAIYFGAGPSLSCSFPSKGPLKAGLSTRRVVSNGVERCYLLYAPPGYAPAVKVPLVFAFHGLAGSPRDMRSMSGWEKLADRQNFLVIYPQGSSFPLRWNTSPAFQIEHIDDVRFFLDLLDELGKIARVDEERIYVSGFSNGAAMTDLLACSAAGRIAAVGLVQGKGENPPQDCKPARPVPVIAFFGTEDPVVAAEYPLWFFHLMNLSTDPAYRQAAPISAWLEGWVGRNGCDPHPQALPPIGDATGASYGACADNADVALYHVEGGGHTWPGGSNLPYFGKISASVEASELMWDFFQHHPRGKIDEQK